MAARVAARLRKPESSIFTWYSEHMASQKRGGAIITWFDPRDSATGFDIFAQHVPSTGEVDLAWPADGLALCTAPGGQFRPRIAGDGVAR